MKSLEQHLREEHSPIFADGSTGAYCMIRGWIKEGEIPETLLDRKPELLQQLTTDYVGAGAQIVLTPTFSATERLLGLQFPDREITDTAVASLNERAANLTRDAARRVNPDTYVVGSIGQLGDFLEPYGGFTEEVVKGLIRAQVTGLRAGEVDGIVIETQWDPTLAGLMVKAARDVYNGPVGVTASFERYDEVQDQWWTQWGKAPAEFMRMAYELQLP